MRSRRVPRGGLVFITLLLFAPLTFALPLPPREADKFRNVQGLCPPTH